MAEQFKTKKYVPKYLQQLANKIKNRNLINLKGEQAAILKDVEIDIILNHLNYFACFLMVLLMFISYASIWILISTI